MDTLVQKIQPPHSANRHDVGGGGAGVDRLRSQKIIPSNTLCASAMLDGEVGQSQKGHGDERRSGMANHDLGLCRGAVPGGRHGRLAILANAACPHNKTRGS